MKPLSRGILIAIEGIDGSGKSTFARNLYNYFSANIPAVLTKEPGGSSLGKKVRPLLQDPMVQRSARAEFLLFAADRAQHFHEVIIPALEQKKLIISDRLSDSSLVYQGFAKGLDIPMLKTINTWAMQEISPDLTIYVKVPLTTALERLKKRADAPTAFERADFLEKIANGFEALYAHNPTIIVIDGRADEQTVFNEGSQAVTEWLTSKGVL